MRLPAKTSASFIILLSLSLSLGACAAHKRDSVAALRTANYKQGQLQAQTKASWATVLTANNPGTFQLLKYQIQVLQDVKSPPILLAGIMISTPNTIGTLPDVEASQPVNLAVTDADKISAVDAIKNLPPIAQEFSAADGTISLMRKDAVTVTTANDGTKSSEEVLTIAAGSGKVTDKGMWGTDNIQIIKQDNGSVEIDRIVVLDPTNKIVTKEQMIYSLKTTPQITDTNADAKLQAPKIDIKPAQL